MALATVDDLRFSYGSGPPVLDGISLRIERRRARSRCSAPPRPGKSTLLRALAGLVPHFHGGTFAGSVVVGGLDTRALASRAARRDGRVGLPGPGGPGRDEPRRQRGRVRAREPRCRPGGDLAACRGGARARRLRAPRRAHRRRAVGWRAAAGLPRVGARAAAAAAAARRADVAARPRRRRRVLRGRRARWTARSSSPSSVPRVRSRYADRVLFMERGRITLDAPRDDALDLARREPSALPAARRPSPSAASATSASPTATASRSTVRRSRFGAARSSR